MSHTDNRLANAAERQAASAEEIARQVTRAADAAVAAFQAMAPIIVQMTESLHRLGETVGRAMAGALKSQEYSRLDTHDGGG
jgi:hypothetical protein